MKALGLSVRRLLKRPGLAAAAVLALALAIGANTAIWSLLDTVALRPLPFPEADRIVHITSVAPELGPIPPEVSWPKVRLLEQQSRVMAAVAAYYQTSFGLTEEDRPEQLAGARVSQGFFDVFGVAPRLGRAFLPAEQQLGGPDVVLLSHGFWQKRFGGDRQIVGRSLSIEGSPTTVIGVLPESLGFPFSDVQIWLPRPQEANFLSRPAIDLGAGYLQVDARLKPGVTAAAAQEELARLVAAYKEGSPAQLDTPFGLTAEPLNQRLVGAAGKTLWVLLAAVGLVLLIACADVANLLLAEGLARRRETAARIALGAGRGHIFGQTLADSLLIAVAGGVLGILLAHWGLRLLVAAFPADLPRLAEVSLDARALGFALLVTAVAALLSALAPAWQTLGVDPKRFLAEGERGSSGGVRAGWAQGLLVTFQVALALVLLSAAGLLLRSLGRVNQLDLGFVPDDLLILQVSLPDAKYPGVGERRVFFDELLTRVRAIPGIESAGLVDYPPASGAAQTQLAVEGAPPVPLEKQPLAYRGIASAGYLPTLKARFLAGRDFDPQLSPDAPLTAIINRTLRDQFFAGRDPLGQHLLLGNGVFRLEVVGVIDDIQQQPVEAGKAPQFFMSDRQMRPELSPPPFLNLAMRTALPVAGVAEAVRREVKAIDPGQPLPELTTMGSLLKTSTSRRRLTTHLFGGFSLVALVLCVLGIYGVVSHAVHQRRREIGIRMALGAGSGPVVATVLRQGLRWIVPGLVLGAAGAWATGRALASQLFEVEGTDWLHFTAVALLLGAVALVACLLPARRATKIDPAVTLRTP